ncbi:MAG TPA: twin-arginine translocase subunit TatC [Planctomycetota bacterium]|nr:twin-arginine translocase subunit TatC [Planctomycetota bacterium]
MTFVQHLDELRTRLLRSIVALLVAIVISMFFYKTLINIAMIPYFRAMMEVRSGPRMIISDLPGTVGAVMKLAAIVGFFVASPYVARELWGFVAGGLYANERRHVKSFAPVSFLLFLLGCVFGYFLLIPFALYAMVSMMPLDKVDPVLALGDYLGFVLTLTILLGLVFQLPLVMVFLTKIGLVGPDQYRSWRKHAILANLVFAAVLSPPDLLSMAVFALPLVVLYEIGLGCSLWARA